MADLNAVETSVSIAGTQVHFTSLQLIQQFNEHHRFEIVVDYEEWGGKWMSDPIRFINLVGEDVNITMKMKQTGETNLFAGIITNVSFSGYHGNQNSIVISGASPTIKLDGKPAMDSFMDLPLLNIVMEAVANSGNGGSVIANPIFKSRLDYICQYNQSCWEFLNYLSWITGEWLFYNGQNTYFGFKNGETVTLEYDKEMTYFDLSANLVPQKFKHYHYLKHDDKEIDKEDPSDVPGVHGYLQVSKGRSEKIYTSDVTTPLMPDINTKKDLDDLVKAEKSRAVGQMLIMRGKTQTCKVKIGGSVKIQLPEYLKVNQSVDRFLVTKITHTIDQEGHYSNDFEGIIDELENVPISEPKLPHAFSQIAVVKDNADPKKWGRVKVQTQWQKEKNKTTNWLRISSTSSGKSDKILGNRGLVTIPEKDDIVMLGFEYGSPDRPFVAGSIFTSKTGKGGGDGNKTKSFISRTGSTVTMDDEKGSVLIADQTGKDNIIIDGNDKISITTTKTIELNNGKSSIVMEDDKIAISANEIVINGKKIVGLISGNETLTLSGEASKAALQGTDVIQQAEKSATVSGKDTTIDASTKITVSCPSDVEISGGLVKINS